MSLIHPKSFERIRWNIKLCSMCVAFNAKLSMLLPQFHSTIIFFLPRDDGSFAELFIDSSIWHLVGFLDSIKMKRIWMRCPATHMRARPLLLAEFSVSTGCQLDDGEKYRRKHFQLKFIGNGNPRIIYLRFDWRQWSISRPGFNWLASRITLSKSTNSIFDWLSKFELASSLLLICNGKMRASRQIAQHFCPNALFLVFHSLTLSHSLSPSLSLNCFHLASSIESIFHSIICAAGGGSLHSIQHFWKQHVVY